jgi:hypothetical protein
MAATTGHSINTGPYGENTEICSSLKLLHWLNLNCASILYKLCGFLCWYSFREEHISVFSPYGPVLILWPVVAAILDFRSA